jgi:hypothetical protein
MPAEAKSPKDLLSKLNDRINRARNHTQFLNALNEMTNYLNLQRRRRVPVAALCGAHR